LVAVIFEPVVLENKRTVSGLVVEGAPVGVQLPAPLQVLVVPFVQVLVAADATLAKAISAITA
jgi:hypothetical protein